jgi:hypothetical protein
MNPYPINGGAYSQQGQPYPPPPPPPPQPPNGASGPGIPGHPHYAYSMPAPYPPPPPGYPPYSPYGPQMLMYGPGPPIPAAAPSAPSPVATSSGPPSKRKRKSGTDVTDKASDDEAGPSGSDARGIPMQKSALADLKKRTKTQRACDSCRSRKIRCVRSLVYLLVDRM